MRKPVPPLKPGTFWKGGRNPGPSTPRPELPPRPMGVPIWVKAPRPICPNCPNRPKR